MAQAVQGGRVEVNQREWLTHPLPAGMGQTERSADEDGRCSGARKLSTPLLATFCHRTVKELERRARIKTDWPGKDSAVVSLAGATVADSQHYEWLVFDYSIL